MEGKRKVGAYAWSLYMPAFQNTAARGAGSRVSAESEAGCMTDTGLIISSPDDTDLRGRG